MSLLVDYPKSGGSGSTNDANLARRFFQDPAMLSKISGIDVTLIDQLDCKVKSDLLFSNLLKFDSILFKKYIENFLKQKDDPKQTFNRNEIRA